MHLTFLSVKEVQSFTVLVLFKLVLEEVASVHFTGSHPHGFFLPSSSFSFLDLYKIAHMFVGEPVA